MWSLHYRQQWSPACVQLRTCALLLRTFLARNLTELPSLFLRVHWPMYIHSEGKQSAKNCHSKTARVGGRKEPSFSQRPRDSFFFQFFISLANRESLPKYERTVQTVTWAKALNIYKRPFSSWPKKHTSPEIHFFKKERWRKWYVEYIFPLKLLVFMCPELFLWSLKTEEYHTKDILISCAKGSSNSIVANAVSNYW